MTARPCTQCGEVIPSGAHCAQHTTTATKPTAHARGYDWHWTKLSKRARRLQPFCLDCGSVTDLQTDHTPEAWAAKAAGKPIKLSMVDVVCGPCNRARGAARGNAVTRGEGPSTQVQDPRGQAKFALHTPRGYP